MKINKKYTYDYLSLNIQAVVARKFRKFSKRNAHSHSETLNAMLDFFTWHGFSPFDQKDRSLIKEVLKNRKRTEAAIAIIKDIEKNNDKPNTAMLQSLFEGNLQEEEPLLIEKKYRPDSQVSTKSETELIPKIKLDRANLELEKVKKDFNSVLEKITVTRNRLGKDYLKVELSEQELLRIKRTLKN